jgi:microcystin-dependent protein
MTLLPEHRVFPSRRKQMNRQRTTAKKLLQQGSAAILFAASISAFACPSDALTGTICITAADYCPSDSNGYLPAQGQALLIQEYQALYSRLGFTFGGSTSAGTFNLPDLRARTPVGLGTGPGLTPVAWGKTRGAQLQQLTPSNLPPHTHTASLMPNNMTVTVPISSANTTTVVLPDSTHNILSGSPTGPTAAAIWTDTQGTVVANVGKVSNSVAGVAGNVSLTSAGQSATFSTLPPQLSLTYCIAAYGTYPVNPN